MSRKAWNNIIIFSMLLMIFLFNTTTNILTGPDDNPSSVSLLPEHAVLMTLQSNGLELQRIGTGWRVMPAIDISQQLVVTIAENWQVASMSSIDSPNVNEKPIVVVAWLAGFEQGLVFQLYQQQQDILIQHQGDWFIIPNSDLEQFTINASEGGK